MARGRARVSTGGSDQRLPEGDGGVPVPGLFAAVIGQPDAVAMLRACARAPVHAYLLRGSVPVTRVAARGFAAALLCPDGGCGRCDHCRRALSGSHPDLVMVERTGASLSVDDARRLIGISQRRPLESARQVLVVADVHLALRAAPALLKTVEEPPSSTVFVLLAEHVPPELVTVASRCAPVLFPPVPTAVVVEWLQGRGIVPEVAAAIAEGAGGDVYRAQLLAEDESYGARLALWRSIPSRLDGSGATVVELTSAALHATESALQPLQRRHADEMAALAAEAEMLGERGVPGRKDIVDRQHREERRWRTDELRAGLAVLARSYVDRLAGALANEGHSSSARGCAQAVDLVNEAAASFDHNPNETLLLEALLVRLGRIGG
jgi:DNA polymerase-3 subunit delta'